ncbi:MAG TPA: hypothetical protein VMN56_08875 [Casimicrobiaceae bacterium]|nr:hypothetical protein [Casimicrobiaceae bacterium]
MPPSPALPEGPWNPGLESQIPAGLLPLATLYRTDHVRTPLRDALELADLTGLPPREIVAFRPQRLALHELLVRVTANVSVPDGTRIEDLGINFRQITQVVLEADVAPRMEAISHAHGEAREALTAIVERELARAYSSQPVPSPARTGWLARLRGERTRASVPAPTEAQVVADWELRARTAEGAERAALRALARVVGAVLVKHERLWGDRDLVSRIAIDLAGNDWGSAVVGEMIEPLVAQAAAREGWRLLPRQERPVVMNTKGPSAAGKSTMRPLQKQLAGRIGVDWGEFALISPDIWRKQLLDYGSLGGAYKYAGALTGDELAIVDQKLDRYMARKAERGEMSHLLIDRFRFDSFAPDSDEAGSNLLTRFGQIVYLFFLVTPPDALVERAWYRGLDVGRYKAVDDTLAHAVEAYAGMPGLFFTWIRRSDKRVHFEFLDNSVARGLPPRTAAFGWNEVMNVLDPQCLLDIERYRKLDVEARSPAMLFGDGAQLAVSRNLAFLRRCIETFREVNFAQAASGRVYASVQRGKVRWIDAQAVTAGSVLEAVLGAGAQAAPPPPQAVFLADDEVAHTVGRWKVR